MSTQSSLRRILDGIRNWKPVERQPSRPTAEQLESRLLATISDASFTFTDMVEGAATGPASAHYTATTDGTFKNWTVNWGDGSSTETITSSVDTAYHSFAGENVSFTVLVTIHDEFSSAGHGVVESSLAGSGTCTVTDAPLYPETNTTFSVRYGHSLNGILGSFYDTYDGDDRTHYTATIDWGDGTDTETGTVDLIDGSFVTQYGSHVVDGNHLYDDGTFYGTVHVLDDDGATTDIPFVVQVTIGPGHRDALQPIEISDSASDTATDIFSSASILAGKSSTTMIGATPFDVGAGNSFDLTSTASPSVDKGTTLPTPLRVTETILTGRSLLISPDMNSGAGTGVNKSDDWVETVLRCKDDDTAIGQLKSNAG